MMDSECHAMVMEYLIHHCFKNTAKALLNETARLENCTSILPKKSIHKIDDDVQWVLLDARKSLTEAITKGDIPEAFNLIKQHFPAFVVDNNKPNNPVHVVLFKLKCQQFIEIIRSATPTSSMEALRYAQTYLKPNHGIFKEKVNEVTALIAYADPHQSHSKHLLSQERRDQLAIEVNHVLLAQCHLPIQSTIEKITRQYKVVGEELSKTVVDRTQRETMAI